MGRNRKPRRESVLLPEESRYFTNRVFHVWGRAIDDMQTFPMQRDKRAFLERIERYLSPREIRDTNYRPYRKLFEKAELLAFCVLDNHYHLLIFQKQEGGLIDLMKPLLTSYGRYFNDTHGRRAQIFESPYSVRALDDHDDVRHMIMYVHTNHEVIGPNYEFCSHREYMDERSTDWVASRLGLAVFESKDDYANLVLVEWQKIRERKQLRRTKSQLPQRRAITRGRGSHISVPNDSDESP